MRTPEVERKPETLSQAQPPRVEKEEPEEIPPACAAPVAAGRWPAGLMLQQEKQPACTLQEKVCVLLTQKAFTQLFGYAYATSQEVSCLGLVERKQSRSDSTRRLASSCFIVTEFFLVRQCSGPAHTEMEDASLAELVQRLIQEGRGEDAQRIRCWAHSHPGMGLFWSQTDEATCRRMVSDYLISLVVTDGFGIRCRLDLASPIRLTLDYVPVLYEMAQDEALKETCRKEVEEKVSALGHDSDWASLWHDDGLWSPSDPMAEGQCLVCGNDHPPGRCPMMDLDDLDWFRKEEMRR